MSLVDALHTGLNALESRSYRIENELDTNGWVMILIPFDDPPVPLRDDELSVQIRVASSGALFTLYSPLALITGELPAATQTHLLRRNFYADQVGGAAYAVMQIQERDVLAAAAHWSLAHITSEQFTALVDQFVTAVFTMIPEINTVAARVPTLVPMNSD